MTLHGGDDARPKRRGLVFSILALLLVVAIATSTLLFVKYRDALHDNPQREREHILTTIRTVVQLPKETPGFSTVIDVSKLTNPILKKRAQNGDRLIIFAKSKRLVIYRPATGKVIDMLTIQSNDVSAATSNQDN